MWKRKSQSVRFHLFNAPLLLSHFSKESTTCFSKGEQFLFALNEEITMYISTLFRGKILLKNLSIHVAQSLYLYCSFA